MVFPLPLTPLRHHNFNGNSPYYFQIICRAPLLKAANPLRTFFGLYSIFPDNFPFNCLSARLIFPAAPRLHPGDGERPNHNMSLPSSTSHRAYYNYVLPSPGSSYYNRPSFTACRPLTLSNISELLIASKLR